MTAEFLRFIEDKNEIAVAQGWKRPSVHYNHSSLKRMPERVIESRDIFVHSMRREKSVDLSAARPNGQGRFYLAAQFLIRNMDT